jgi:hypothetical protein
MSNPLSLLKGYNYLGQVCGVDVGDSFVYYPRPPSTTFAVCISACPTAFVPYFCLPSAPAACLASPSVLTQLDCLKNYTSGNFSTCFPTYRSFNFSTRCVPDIGANFTAVAQQTLGNVTVGNFSSATFVSVINNGVQNFGEIVGNVARNWRYIAISAAVALGIAIVYTQLLRLCAMAIAWVTLISFELLIIALTVILAVRGTPPPRSALVLMTH